MIYELKRTKKFRKDVKSMIKRGKNPELLLELIDRLQHDEALASKHHDHELTGDYAGFRECHIEPDWLLVYRKNNRYLILTMVRTGSHSDLF